MVRARFQKKSVTLLRQSLAEALGTPLMVKGSASFKARCGCNFEAAVGAERPTKQLEPAAAMSGRAKPTLEKGNACKDNK